MFGYKSIVQLPRRRNILLFSDLQYSENITKKKLDFLLCELQCAIQDYKIDYLFFLGDLINSLDDVSDPTRCTLLLRWLQQLAATTPLIIISGNHDYSYRGQNARNSRIYRRWCKQLRAIPNLYLLEHGQHIFDDGQIRILGFTLPDECYPTSKVSEYDAITSYSKRIKQLLPMLKAVQNRDYYLLVHSPRHINITPLDNDIFAIAGHTHNGLIPPIANELLRFSTRGLIVPGYKVSPTRSIRYELFSPNARLRPKPTNNDNRPLFYKD